MASTATGRRLTTAHYRAQARLGARTARRLVQVWPLLDPMNLDATTPAWMAAASGIIADANRESADLAAAYVRRFRAAELVDPDPLTLPTLATVNPTAVESSLRVTGPVWVKRGVAAGHDLAVVVQAARTVAAAAGKRHALSGGRSVVTATVDADPACLGYARVGQGDSCPFCAMLISRGPVYGRDSHRFRAHDDCDCTAEPVYDRGTSWPPGAEQLREVWERTTAGLTGRDAFDAFRRALTAAG